MREREIDLESLIMAKERLASIFNEAIGEVEDADTGDQLVDVIAPLINELIDIKQATYRDLAGSENNSLRTILNKLEQQ